MRPEGFETLTRNRTSALKDVYFLPFAGKPSPVPPGAAQTAEKSADLGMRKEREASCTRASRLPRTAGAVAFGTRKADPAGIFECRHRRDRPQFSRFAAPGASEQLFSAGGPSGRREQLREEGWKRCRCTLHLASTGRMPCNRSRTAERANEPPATAPSAEWRHRKCKALVDRADALRDTHSEAGGRS